jgi:hypothetical protein
MTDTVSLELATSKVSEVASPLLGDEHRDLAVATLRHLWELRDPSPLPVTGALRFASLLQTASDALTRASLVSLRGDDENVACESVALTRAARRAMTVEVVNDALTAMHPHATGSHVEDHWNLIHAVLRVCFTVFGPFEPNKAQVIGAALASVGEALSHAADGTLEAEKIADAAVAGIADPLEFLGAGEDDEAEGEEAGDVAD